MHYFLRKLTEQCAFLSRFLEVFQVALSVYGLIHARYIASPGGLRKMRDKLLRKEFGECPRVLCE